MRYPITVHEFSFNKIKSGLRKVSVHLFDKNMQQVKLGDILSIKNVETAEVIDCEVKGIAIFSNFEDIIEALSAKALGYDSVDELLLRAKRVYPEKVVKEFNMAVFFIKILAVNSPLTVRDELER